MTSKIAAMLVFADDTVALGLETAQNIRFAVSFCRDSSEASRAFGTRFVARDGGHVPTIGHAAAYASTMHYLQAVAKAGVGEAGAVQKAMAEMPTTDGSLRNPRMLADGRVVMDMPLVEVKTPAESKAPADISKVIGTLPGEGLFTPAGKSGCTLTAG